MASPWIALPAGVDPLRLSRSLAVDHGRFVSDGARPRSVRDVVRGSWQRARRLGVNPDAGAAPIDEVDDALKARRDAHPLAQVMPVLRRILIDDAVDCGLLVAVADADGRLLWVEGASDLKARAESMNFMPGAVWSEAAVGTNAPGTALALDHAVQIFGHEHYTRVVQAWSCSAAPIHDPITGEIIGVLDVTGGDLVAAPQSLALVQTAVHAVEAEMRLQAIENLRSSTSRPAVRTSTPSPMRLQVLGRDHAMVQPSNLVLSPRHSELLFLLAQHPAGMTAEQLAVELHDEDFPLVTVRAEMSRLRSVLGSRAPMSRPYRLQAGVDSDAAEVLRLVRAGRVSDAVAAYVGPVLPSSESPGIGRVRRRIHGEVRAAVLAAGDPAMLLAWGDSEHGRDDTEVWAAAVTVSRSGSAERAVAQMRLDELEAEFGLPSAM